MPYPAKVLKVLIASPSDLPDERQIAKQALHDWNDLHAEYEGITLEPVMWETRTTPEVGVRPQEALNKQFVRSCDLAIALFGTRLGTNTGVADSGTVEEIDELSKAGKPVLLYFSKKPVVPSKIDLSQLQKLRDFQSQTYKTAVVNDFDSDQDLRHKLSRDLVRQVRTLKAANIVTPTGSTGHEHHVTVTCAMAIVGPPDDYFPVVGITAVNSGRRPVTIRQANLQLSNNHTYLQPTSRILGTWKLPARLEESDKVDVLFEAFQLYGKLTEFHAAIGKEVTILHAVVEDTLGRKYRSGSLSHITEDTLKELLDRPT